MARRLERRGAVGRQVAAGRVQDFRGDLRPGAFPGGTRRRQHQAAVADLLFRFAHPLIIAQERDRRQQSRAVLLHCAIRRVSSK